MSQLQGTDRLDNPGRYTLTNAKRWDEWVEHGISWGIARC